MTVPGPDPSGHPPIGATDPPNGNAGSGPTRSPLVVIPHVRGQLRTEVVEAAIRSGLPVRLVQTDLEDDGGYAQLLTQLWQLPREWVLCEQDTVPPDGVLAAMVRCDHPWCTVRHWVGTHWETRSLGVARFALQLRVQLPLVADQVLGPPWHGHPWRHWRVCDTQLARDMMARGIDPHVHPGRTRHLHHYSLES